MEDTKLERLLFKNPPTQRKLLNFGFMFSCQKVPKFDFQSQFSMSKKHPNLSLFFIEEYHFRSTFFVIDIFKSLYDDALFLTTRHQSKTQNSIISYWYDDSYLCKNRSNFYPPRERSATHIAKM